MREILFRGQTRKYGEKVRIGDGQKLPGRWVYGGVLQGAVSHSIIYGGENINDPSQSIEKWCVHTDTLGQYTGLKDKHGKRIFEGDILKWDSMEWGCDHLEIASWDYELFNMRRNDWEEWCEVIGNIHDNPKLCSSEEA